MPSRMITTELKAGNVLEKDMLEEPKKRIADRYKRSERKGALLRNAVASRARMNIVFETELHRALPEDRNPVLVNPRREIGPDFCQLVRANARASTK